MLPSVLAGAVQASPLGRVALAGGMGAGSVALKAANPAKAARIRFIGVDRDQWGQSAIVRDLAIPPPLHARPDARRGGTRPAMSQTGREAIKAAHDSSLAAA